MEESGLPHPGEPSDVEADTSNHPQPDGAAHNREPPLGKAGEPPLGKNEHQPPLEDPMPAGAELEKPTLAIQDLIESHHLAIFRYAYRLAGDHEDAEDLCQQTFLIAHRKLHQIRQPEKARGWLYAVLRSCYLKSKRKQRPTAAANVEMDVNEIPQLPEKDDHIDGERLQAAVNSLPDDYKVVLLMFYFEKCSYKEIAAKLDLPVGTVMSRLSRAKNRLRGRLSATEIEA